MCESYVFCLKALSEISAMRAAFIVSFSANLILSLVSLVVLPDTVAIHFRLGGAADGWASSSTNTLMMLGMDTLLFCSLYFAPRLLAGAPRKWISLPNRDYWLSPDRLPLAVQLFARHMWRFGTALFLFMFVAGLLSLRANLSDPVRLDESVLLTALAIFLGYTVYWTVMLVRAFRIPEEDT